MGIDLNEYLSSTVLLTKLFASYDKNQTTPRELMEVYVALPAYAELGNAAATCELDADLQGLINETHAIIKGAIDQIYLLQPKLQDIV
jgi:hypothetical protein